MNFTLRVVKYDNYFRASERGTNQEVAFNHLIQDFDQDYINMAVGFRCVDSWYWEQFVMLAELHNWSLIVKKY